MIRSIFFGTPEAAVPSLVALERTSEVEAVVTQPDRPRGRSGTPAPPPVKEAALELGLQVLQPTRLSDVTEVAARCDIGVLVAFGRLIKPQLLTAPRLGIVNVHFSVLPRWRGAAPVQAALLAGDDRTGVTLMQMDEGLDTGPVLRVAETAVSASENAGDLMARLAEMGADLLAGTFADLGGIVPQPQDDKLATSAPSFEPEAARLRPRDTDAADLGRAIRAFSPRPGAWGQMEGERFKILAARPVEYGPGPGVIDEVSGVPVLGAAQGGLVLELVQPAGKPQMEGDAWWNGRQGRAADLS